MTIKQGTPIHNKRPSRQRQRLIWGLGVGTLFVILLLSSVASMGRHIRNPALVEVSEHSAPPNAEPNGRAWGPVDAPIQVLEYADYECEACGYFARMHEAEVIAAFAMTGKVRFEIRNAPFHGQGARNAAAASYCAAEQNAFWPMHDSLFMNQPKVEGTGPQVFSKDRLNNIAAQLGLDTTAFEQCLATNKYADQVETDYMEAARMGVTGTPTFVINGKMYPAILGLNDMRQIFAEVAPDVDLTP